MLRFAGKCVGFMLFLALPFLAALFLLRGEKVGLRFETVAFEELPGWQSDQLIAALPALQKSCDRILTLPPKRRIPGAKIGGKALDWYEPCGEILLINSDNQLRETLTRYFTPLAVSLSGEVQGTFTGYYETLLNGSEVQTERYHVPLYAKPDNLVSVELGAFRPDLKGRRIAGRVENGRLLRVGYAGQNGHPYYAIGRRLIAMGAVPPEDMSMQAIRGWLSENPEQAEEILHTNPSFIFFRMLSDSDGPIGSAGVALTGRRSLAVDRQHLPLHAPIWLSTTYPNPEGHGVEPLSFNHLMVAQDTGGAINGEIRGDVFWGFGHEAEEIAGRMANSGRYWLLLPKALAAKAVEEGS